MSQGIKRPFCLDVHRVTDLEAFPIQSFESEALSRLIMSQTSGGNRLELYACLTALSSIEISFT